MERLVRIGSSSSLNCCHGIRFFCGGVRVNKKSMEGGTRYIGEAGGVPTPLDQNYVRWENNRSMELRFAQKFRFHALIIVQIIKSDDATVILLVTTKYGWPPIPLFRPCYPKPTV